MSQKITIQQVVHQPIQKVWEMFNAPEHMTKWNFADESWHCPYAQNNLTVGGKLFSRMEARDGSFGFDYTGTYEVIEHHKKIVYRLDDGRGVQTDFDSLGNDTRITITFDAEKENPIEMQSAGWNAILGNFKKYAES